MPEIVSIKAVASFLEDNHYLGPARRGFAIQFQDGVMVFSNPSSRRLPNGTWLELTRWCIAERGGNRGSKQWAMAVKLLKEEMPEVTTIVSYSDPAQGHTGALYRACNWLWAPTWHRLRPPPSGNGEWTSGKTQAVKDRWVFPLRPDSNRGQVLQLQDSSLRKKMPWAEYKEAHPRPIGGNYKRFMNA